MDFGTFAFTPDGVAAVVAGFAVAGVVLGVLVAALGSLIDAIRF